MSETKPSEPLSPHVMAAIKQRQRNKMQPIKNDNEANVSYKEHLLVPVEPRPEVHFITTLNQKFIPGFQRLMGSLEESSKLDNWDMTVVAMDEYCKEAKKASPRVVDVFDVSSHEKKLALKTSSPRFQYNFNKLCVFSLPTDHVYIFIDSDTFCVGDLNALRSWKPNITAVRNFVINEKTKREQVNYQRGTLPIFNTGVFCFKPDAELHQQLMAFARKHYRGGVRLGDQEIMNDFFAANYPDQVQYAPYEYNYRGYIAHQMLHPRSPTHGEPLREDPKIIHLIHEIKPWMPGDVKKENHNAALLWKKEITLDEYLKRDRKERGL